MLWIGKYGPMKPSTWSISLTKIVAIAMNEKVGSVWPSPVCVIDSKG
jgi:hypothetical protein